MKRIVCLALVALAVSVPAHLPAGDVVNGNWRLTTLVPMGNSETTNWLFKVETTEGKTTAKLLGGVPAKSAELVSFDVIGDKVRVVVKSPGEQVFEGRVIDNGKKIVGVFVGGKAPLAAYMATTQMEELEKASTGKVTASVEELKAWADVATAIAKEHGAAIDVNMQFAAALLAKKNASLAAEYALAAEKFLNDRSSVDTQVKVLQIATRTLSESGKGQAAQPFAARLEKLEKMLDAKYDATVPPFKAKPFGGRKEQSDRAVVMELFTGAQCPPCVAADVAFDVLGKSYTPKELVLIQYHLHIPGPDPMTNADSEARAKYYKASSTPSTFFNGSKQGSGGGAMAAAEKKYKAYCDIIDPLLEENAGCKVSVIARLVNNKVQIQADVAGVEKPGKDIKLRLVLVEPHIRFVGSNSLRFHHQVVRAMPGGVDGVSVTNPTLSVKNEVMIPDLLKEQVKYLDIYDLTKRPFPQIPRPLDFHHLRVIAFVQDDSTQEILQAVQVDVKE